MNIRKTFTRATLSVGAVGVLALGGISCAAEEETPKPPESNSQDVQREYEEKKQKESKQEQQQDSRNQEVVDFKAFVTSNGTPQEQEAVNHVTKIKSDEWMATADIHTDLTQDKGLSTKGMDMGNLISSSYAEFNPTDEGDGMVTIYDSSGGVLTIGNY